MPSPTCVKQRDLTDCGAACLASIAAHYRLYLPVSRIRQYASTDRRGTNVLGMIEAATKLGFEAKGAKGKIDSLFKIPLPAIVHVQLPNGLLHFMVLYKASPKALLLMDPADGAMHKKTIAAFEKIWTGVVILLLPTAEFVVGKQTQSHSSRFWQLIAPHRSVMVQALVGALVYTLLGLSTSLYVQKIVDFVLPEGNLQLLNLLSVVMIVLLVFQLFIGSVKSIFALKTGQAIDAQLILGYYQHLLRLPQRFFDTMRVGEIISRVNDAVKIRAFINETALGIVVNVFIVVLSLAVMFYYYWKLALVAVCIVPLYVVIYFISNRVSKIWQRRLMENSAELESQLVESLNSAATIKQFGLESYANEKTESRFIVLLRNVYSVSIKNLYIGNGGEFITRLLTIVLLWVGSYFVIDRQISPGELLSFYALIGYFTGPAMGLIAANKQMQEAVIAADRLFEIIDLESEYEAENTIQLTAETVGDIEFKAVNFKYGSRGAVFEQLNLCIKKGASTGIVGESGSGKSTLIALLQNLYAPQAGQITIGGKGLNYIAKASLRRLVSVVPQQIDLFMGSLLENIAIGDTEPNAQRVMELCVQLGLDEFIQTLPAGYATIVSEQGVNFSGGQKQRIAIARALYRDPEILILDEATSNLDPTSERQVQQTLQQFKNGGKTLIIIAHRLSTIKHCDTIIVLEKGHWVEQGSHEQLMNQESRYKALWQAMI